MTCRILYFWAFIVKGENRRLQTSICSRFIDETRQLFWGGGGYSHWLPKKLKYRQVYWRQLLRTRAEVTWGHGYSQWNNVLKSNIAPHIAAWQLWVDMNVRGKTFSRRRSKAERVCVCVFLLLLLLLLDGAVTSHSTCDETDPSLWRRLDSADHSEIDWGAGGGVASDSWDPETHFSPLCIWSEEKRQHLFAQEEEEEGSSRLSSCPLLQKDVAVLSFK